MSEFKMIRERAVPLNQNNVDTDQIIPARFLKGTAKTGLGKNLFNDWRYLAAGSSGQDGKPNPEFSLNKPQYAGAKILVAAHNFGCGSSREHAPWALTDYGFKAVIAISFADIFKNNSLKNRLLPVALPEATVIALLGAVEKNPALEIEIDLEAQTVTASGFETQRFDIDPFRKNCIMQGVDDIGYTLGYLPDIEAFERGMA